MAAFPAPWAFADTNHLYSDASDIAIGAVYNAAWFHLSFTGSYGYLVNKSINYREMYAAVRALATWGSSLRNSRVTLHIDNQAVCGCINRGASQSADLMALVRSYALLVSEYNLECRAFYIESQANDAADALSRLDLRRFRAARPDADSTMTWPVPVWCDGDLI